MTTDARRSEGQGWPGLTAADAAALDALIESGGDLTAVPQDLRARAERARRLLAALEAPVEGRAARVTRVMDAIGAAEAAASRPVLTPDDAEALDALVLAGFDEGRVPSSLRQRARAHRALADLASAPSATPESAEARDSLIARTLAAVEASVAVEEEAYSFRSIPLRNRWADLLSVAAVMLIGVSLLWPVMSTVRNSAQVAGCDSHLRSVAMAMGHYTGDNDEVLPMVNAGFGGGTWWNVGRNPKQSNSANLFSLAREGYATLENLACPGNPRAPTAATSPDARDWRSIEEISYSYRVMARPERELWGTPSRLVVVADRSPVVLRAVHGQTIYPFESSPNHRRRGQHALMADGASRWLESPVLESGDNIWLPKSIEMLIDYVSRRAGFEPLKGTEAPADRDDSFVGP